MEGSIVRDQVWPEIAEAQLPSMAMRHLEVVP